MRLTGKKLKKTGEGIYQELDGTTGRPLEWRRSFNVLNLSIEELSVVTQVSVNKVDVSLSLDSDKIAAEREKLVFEGVTPNAKTSRKIVGKVIEHHDTIYSIDKIVGEADLYEVQKPCIKMKVILEEAEIRQDRFFPNGVYNSALYVDELGDEGFDMCLSSGIPPQQMDDLLRSIEKHPQSQLKLTVQPLSYTFEVDDALREWWMPQDIIINGSAIAPITYLQLSQKNPNSLETDDSGDGKKSKSPLTENEKLLLAIKRAALPLWVIGLLLLFHLFK